MKTGTWAWLIHWIGLALESVFASGNRQRNAFDHQFDGRDGGALASVLALAVVGLLAGVIYWNLTLPRVYKTSIDGRVVCIRDYRGNILPTNTWSEVLKGTYDQYPPLP